MPDRGSRSGELAPSFLAEVYTPMTTGVADVEARARLAACELSAAGTPVSYVGSILVPDDETCFHLFEAASAKAVAQVADSAGFAGTRINRAVATRLGRVPLAQDAISRS